MIAIPSLVFASPRIDVDTGNDIMGMSIDIRRLASENVLYCSVIFCRESAYNIATGTIDIDATALLLANSSLHYGRTADIERFLLIFDGDGQPPLGIGFGSYGAPQSWVSGLGPTIELPVFVPLIGGRRFSTFQDDIPLTQTSDPRVYCRHGINIFPWDALERVQGDPTARRLYVSTPNHLFDVTNRNVNMPHVDQKYGTGRFQQMVELPSEGFTSAEDLARLIPDESNHTIREAVFTASQILFGRPWLF